MSPKQKWAIEPASIVFASFLAQILNGVFKLKWRWVKKILVGTAAEFYESLFLPRREKKKLRLLSFRIATLFPATASSNLADNWDNIWLFKKKKFKPRFFFFLSQLQVHIAQFGLFFFFFSLSQFRHPLDIKSALTKHQSFSINRL